MVETTSSPGAADQARDKAQEVGAQAKDKAQEAGAQARSRLRDEVDTRSTQAGEQAGSTAQALRQASQKLRDEGNEPVAKGMERVAERVDTAGSWMRDADGDTILRDVEDFGRRNPLVVIAGGLALGFAASRMLKASSRRRYESHGFDGGNGRALPRTTSPATGAGGVHVGDVGEPGAASRREGFAPPSSGPEAVPPREPGVGPPPTQGIVPPPGEGGVPPGSPVPPGERATSVGEPAGSREEGWGSRGI